MSKLSSEEWAKARIIFETDVTANCSNIAKEIGVTRQAVDKRMRTESWIKATNDTLVVAQDLPVTATSGKATPEMIAQFLNCLSLLRNEKLACAVIGVDPSTVRRWRESDPAFARQVQVSRARKVTSWIDTVDRAAQRDYKAALELLKRAPETRDTFGETHDTGPQIVFNIVRDVITTDP
jgi:hypothetical protein